MVSDARRPGVEVASRSALLELVPHLLGEVGGEPGLGARLRRRGHDPQRLPQRLLGERPRDAPLVAQQRQHQVVPGERLVGMPAGVVVGGRLGEAGEERRLGEGQLAGRVAEVLARRRLDPLGSVAEIDVVEVELEDLLLRVAALDLLRHPDLEELAASRLLLAGDALGEDVAGELHRDRAEPLREAAGPQVGEHRAPHPLPVHSAVLVEALVLDGEEGLRHHRGEGGERHDLALGGREVGERLAVAVEQHRRAPRLEGGEPGDVRAGGEEASRPGEAEEEHRGVDHGEQDRRQAPGVLQRLRPREAPAGWGRLLHRGGEQSKGPARLHESGRPRGRPRVAPTTFARLYPEP